MGRGTKRKGKIASGRTQIEVLQAALDRVSAVLLGPRMALEDHAGVGLMVVERPSGRIVHANRGFRLVLFGRQGEESGGKKTPQRSLQHLVHPDDAPRLVIVLAQSIQGETGLAVGGSVSVRFARATPSEVEALP